jgi:hypothetical protein
MIHIEDNFFKDPFSVRNSALKSTYKPKVDFNYPGHRSDVPDHLSEYVLSNVRKICRDPSLKILNGDISFQYIPKVFGSGSFHTDSSQYTCVVYLYPEAPNNSGTEICDNNQKGISPKLLSRMKESSFKDPNDLIKRYGYGIIRKYCNSFYKPIVQVPNKFNRLVIFPGRHFHREQSFFGNSLVDSRLTLISFFA